MSNGVPLYRVAQIRAKEKALLAAEQLSVAELMARAGEALWSVLSEHWSSAKRCLVVCGAGNNGGDGWVLARLAHAHGMSVQVLSAVPVDTLEGLSAEVAQAALQAGVQASVWDEGDWPVADVVVDALLGIGIGGELRAPMPAMIAKINAMQAPVLAVDVPSGLCADTGVAAQGAVKALMTVTMVAHKVGLYMADGRDVSGMVVCQDLGVSALYERDTITPVAHLQPHWQNALPRRQANSHKGQFGHVLVAGGDPGMGGAGLLVSMAAFRLGAGKVTALAHTEQVAGMMAACPACMTLRLSPESYQAGEFVFVLPKHTNVVVLGPGLGRHASAQALWRHTMAMADGISLVLDADGLYHLSQMPQSLPASTVLTPHPGEAATLLGQTVVQIQADRLVAAQAIADQYQAVCVLKGAGTVVAQPGELPLVLPVGNPCLAKAGCGDVLAGMVAALMAQGVSAWQAAVMAVGLHGKAADEAAASLGVRAVVPDDLLRYVGL